MNNSDTFAIILSYLGKITDVRNLSRITKKSNELCDKSKGDLIKEYKQKYGNFLFAKHFDEWSQERITVEIVLDTYLRMLPEKYFNRDNQIITPMLALCGDLNLLKEAYTKSCKFTSNTANCAAYGGHLHILEWLVHKLRLDMNKDSIVKNCIAGGHIHILDWCKTNGYGNDKICFMEAIKCGQITVLQWLAENRIRRFDNICIEAVNYGQPGVLTWAIKNKYILSPTFCLDAVRRGHVNILQWAHNNYYHNYLKNEELMNMAIVESKIDILQWFYDNGYSIDNEICIKTVKYGHVELLRWLLKHGFDLHKTFFEDVVNKHNVPMLQLILDNHYGIPENIYECALRYNKPSVVQWLIKNDLFVKKVNLKIDHCNSKMIMLLQNNNYLEINVDTCVELVSADLTFLEHVEKCFVKKKQYHFKICKNVIMIEPYGQSDCDDGQKIIDYWANGHIDICSLDCSGNCWWYFYMFCKTKVVEVKKFTRDKVCKCPKHKVYCEYFV